MEKVLIEGAVALILSEMEDADRTIRKIGGGRGVVGELKAEGLYTTDFILSESEKVKAKTSTRSARIRGFVRDVMTAAELKAAEGTTRKILKGE